MTPEPTQMTMFDNSLEINVYNFYKAFLALKRDCIKPIFFKCKYVSCNISTVEVKLNYGFGKQIAQQLPKFKILWSRCLGTFLGEINYWRMVTTFKDAFPEKRQEMVIGWLRSLQRTATHVEHAVGGKRACFGTNCVTHQHQYQLRLNKARQECQIQQANTTCFTEKCDGPKGWRRLRLPDKRSCAGWSRAPSSCV